MERQELDALFAKIELLNGDKSDKLLVEYLAGITGGFHTKLIDAYMSADYFNKGRLIDCFPELMGIDIYMNDPEYYKEFKKKFGL